MFKMYSEADLIELKYIYDTLRKRKKLDKIDYQTAVSVFEGHTIFSLFGNDEKLHVQLYNQISEADWPEAE